MARKRTSRTSSATGGGAAGRTLLAFVVGVGAAAGAGYFYLHSRPQPATPPSTAAPIRAEPGSDTPASSPRPTVSTPPHVRSAPFGTSEDVFEAGARIYSVGCAGCHGTPQKNASPSAPALQLWRKGRHTLAARAPGDLYDQIAQGAPERGMPAYAHTLTETQIWQLALLLHDADEELPDPVLAILNAPSGTR